MQEIKLTPTSYIVLGHLEWAGGEATPYELKRMAGLSTQNFWPLQHAQFYTEPERLARGGYVDEEREESGRRRRTYRLTERGREALREWTSLPAGEHWEVRDTATLKLFFGADPGAVAEAQLPLHQRQLAEYEALRATDPGEGPRGPWIALDAGIWFERAAIEFLSRLAGDHQGRRKAGKRDRKTSARTRR